MIECDRLRLAALDAGGQALEVLPRGRICPIARRDHDVLTAQDRPVWATALYAGLRLGELRALRVEDVDLTRRLIHVRRGWDQYEGEQEPESCSGRRRVPMWLPSRSSSSRYSSGFTAASSSAEPRAEDEAAALSAEIAVSGGSQPIGPEPATLN